MQIASSPAARYCSTPRGLPGALRPSVVRCLNRPGHLSTANNGHFVADNKLVSNVAEDTPPALTITNLFLFTAILRITLKPSWTTRYVFDKDTFFFIFCDWNNLERPLVTAYL